MDSDSVSEDVDESNDVIVPPPKRAKIVPSDTLQWIDKYTPLLTKDVCMNPRKIKEIRDSIVRMSEGTQPKLLIISGPAGSSKSTAVKCIAAEQALPVTEFIEGTYNPTRLFEEFLAQARYMVGTNKSLILIEELPNVFHEDTLRRFRHALDIWLHSESVLPPVVLCLTEVELVSLESYYSIETSLTVETLLGRNLLDSGLLLGFISRITVLPVAKLFMKKTLQAILHRERIRIAPNLEPLIENGDIRAAISNLQLCTQSRIDPAAMVREKHILLFHAIGKVIYLSSKYLAEDEDIADYLSIQDVLENYTNSDLLNLALLENYDIVDLSVASTASIVDALSIEDAYSRLSLGLGPRATRHHIRGCKVISRIQKMKFPRHYKSVRAAASVRRMVTDYITFVNPISFASANLHDGYYLPLIFNSPRYRKLNGNSRYLYNRLGGPFQALEADSEMPTNDTRAPNVSTDQFAEDIRQNRENGPELEDSLSEAIDDTTDSDFWLDDLVDALISQGRI